MFITNKNEKILNMTTGWKKSVHLKKMVMPIETAQLDCLCLSHLASGFQLRCWTGSWHKQKKLSKSHCQSVYSSLDGFCRHMDLKSITQRTILKYWHVGVLTVWCYASLWFQKHWNIKHSRTDWPEAQVGLYCHCLCCGWTLIDSDPLMTFKDLHSLYVY